MFGLGAGKAGGGGIHAQFVTGSHQLSEGSRQGARINRVGLFKANQWNGVCVFRVTYYINARYLSVGPWSGVATS